MPAPILTISKTFLGSGVADTLPGGSTGYEGGQSETGGTPAVNTIYLRHNGTMKISNLSYCIEPYTGVYGGDYSISADFAKAVAHGSAGGGMQFDEIASAAPFSGTFYQVQAGAGVSFATRKQIAATAMLKSTAGVEGVPSAPVAGEVGLAGDTVLGQSAKIRQRYVVPGSETQGGRRQVDIVFYFAHTEV